MEFFQQFIDFIKNINMLCKKFKYRKYLNTSSKVGNTKHYIGTDYTMTFSSAFETSKKEVIKEVEQIVAEAKNNPYDLINYIEKDGTKIYRVKNADKILALIKEQEGFITPKKGVKALYLNLVLNKTIGFKFKECFVMRNLALDPYYTIHQFYTWYAFKSGFAGYDYKTQEKFNELVTSKNLSSKIGELSISEIIAVKEAIHRDVEALDFVINLAKNYEGSKAAFQKMINGSASV